ncbi:MAG: hypothetical protein KJ906_04500 [Nanoarchaeota archaeon]|nr:hypothetical protein [Nanoarchaeota archaeon]
MKYQNILLIMSFFLVIGLLQTSVYAQNTRALELHEGWNLIGPSDRMESVTCEQGDITSYFIFNPWKQLYIPSGTSDFFTFRDEHRSYMLNTGIWLEVKKDCIIKYAPMYRTTATTPILKGSNLLVFSSEVHLKTLDEIKGSCVINSANYYDSINQKWTELGTAEPIDDSLFGLGFVLNVEDDCELEEILKDPAVNRGSLLITATDEETGEPLENIGFRATIKGIQYEVMTNANGNAWIEDLSPTKFDLIASNVNYEEESKWAGIVSGQWTEIQFILTERENVGNLLIDVAGYPTDTPLSNAIITIIYNNRTIYTETSENGKAEFKDIPVGIDVKIKVTKEGYSSYEETIKMLAREIMTEVRLVEGGSVLEVLVYDTNGNSVDNAIVKVKWDDNSVTGTSSDGVATFENVATSKIDVDVTKTNYNDYSSQFDIPKYYNAHTVSAIVFQEGEEGGRIGLTITDENGNSIENALVEITYSDLGTIANTYSDSNGLASIENLLATEITGLGVNHLLMRVWKDGYDAYWEKIMFESLKSGEVFEVEVTLI